MLRVFFSRLIYFIGYKLRAGESEWNELHVVDVLRNGERAELRGRTFVSIYSPANTNTCWRASEVRHVARRVLASGGGQTSEGERSCTRATTSAPRSSCRCGPASFMSATGGIRGRCRLRSRSNRRRRLALSVQNLTDHPVTAAQLAVGEALFAVGELTAGQTKTMKLAKASGVALPEFVRASAQSYFSQAQQRQNAFGSRSGGQINDLPNASMVASFLGQQGTQPNAQNFIAPPGLDLSAVIAHGNAVLLASAQNSAPVPPVNQVKSKRAAADTLWRVPVEIKN